MANINFTIPDDKISRIVTAMKGLYPIPVDEETGEPQFTDNQWAKESVRRWIRDQVARYEQREAINDIAFSPEDDIIS